MLVSLKTSSSTKVELDRKLHFKAISSCPTPGFKFRGRPKTRKRGVFQGAADDFTGFRAPGELNSRGVERICAACVELDDLSQARELNFTPMI